MGNKDTQGIKDKGKSWQLHAVSAPRLESLLEEEEEML